MTQIFHSKKLLYFFSFGSILSNILAILSIDLLWDLPNAWLVLYGIGVVCLWHSLGHFQSFVLSAMSFAYPIRLKYVIYFIVLFLFSVSGTILSSNASYWLAPRSIIQDILGISIYFSGTILSFLMLYYGYRLHHAKSSHILRQYEKMRTLRLEDIENWRMKQGKNDIPNRKSDLLTYIRQSKVLQSFSIRSWQYIFRRLIYVGIWTLIPLWIFWMIPERSVHGEKLEIHWIFHLGTVITVLASLGWTFWLIRCANTRYEFYPAGMIVYRLWETQVHSWSQIQAVWIDQENIRIQSQHHPSIKIPILEIQNREFFWDELQKHLPLGMFFANEEGLYNIRKVTKNSIFDQKYERIHSTQVTH